MTRGPSSFPPRSTRARARLAAFTLSELMVAMGILLIVFGGLVASHLFGMKIMEKVSAKAGASAEARENLNILLAEVGSAKSVAVGSGSQSSFSESAIDTAQQGAALQIYPTTSTNIFIRYYLDTTAKTLNRMTNGGTGVAAAVLLTSTLPSTPTIWSLTRSARSPTADSPARNRGRS